MAQLAHIFFDVDLRQSHIGLRAMLKKKKIAVRDGDFGVFLNTPRTMIKCFCNSTDALLHVTNNKHRIDLGVLKYLPKHCNGPTLAFEKAVADHIRDWMEKRKSDESRRR